MKRVPANLTLIEAILMGLALGIGLFFLGWGGLSFRHRMQVKQMVDAMERITASSGSPTFQSNVETVCMLAREHPELHAASDKDGWTPLHWAAWSGNREVVALLLAKGAKANAKGPGGWMPLHLAARSGYKDVAELLLAHGAEINAEDTDGQTPLHKAIRWGHKGVADLLRAHGGKE